MELSHEGCAFQLKLLPYCFFCLSNLGFNFCIHIFQHRNFILIVVCLFVNVLVQTLNQPNKTVELSICNVVIFAYFPDLFFIVKSILIKRWRNGLNAALRADTVIHNDYKEGFLILYLSNAKFACMVISIDAPFGRYKSPSSNSIFYLFTLN